MRRRRKVNHQPGQPSFSSFIIATATTQGTPKEATILPLLDNPVTLSLNKGGLSASKPALTGNLVVISWIFFAD